jgi:hypothetical protein
MARAVHKPSRELPDPKDLLLGYLDCYRSVITSKIDGMPERELRISVFNAPPTFISGVRGGRRDGPGEWLR